MTFLQALRELKKDPDCKAQFRCSLVNFVNTQGTFVIIIIIIIITIISLLLSADDKCLWI